METKQVTVWDPLVRIMHWTLVLSFAAAYLTGEEWDEWEEVHEFGGYIALGLIVLRILWGFIGTQHARFSDFIYSPASVVEYLKSLLTTHPKHYLGHNPAGGWMILLLMAGVLATGFTGLKLLGVKEHEGLFANTHLQLPALISSAQAESEREEARERAERAAAAAQTVAPANAVTTQQAAPAMSAPATLGTLPTVAPPASIAPKSATVEDEEHENEAMEEPEEKYWEEWHELAANLTLFLVIIHVLGVIVSSRLHGENLARAMVTGKKNTPV